MPARLEGDLGQLGDIEDWLFCMQKTPTPKRHHEQEKGTPDPMDICKDVAKNTSNDAKRQRMDLECDQVVDPIPEFQELMLS